MTRGPVPMIKTKEYLRSQLNKMRSNILICAIATMLGLILVLIGLDSFFIYSAALPSLLLLYFAIHSGWLMDEFYKGSIYENAPFPYSEDTVFAMAAVAVVIIAFLGVLWYLCGKKKLFAYVALGFFTFDTLFLLAFGILGIGVSSPLILNLICHGYLIYACYRTVKLFDEYSLAPTAAEVAAQASFAPGAPYGGVPFGNTPYGNVPYGNVPYGNAPYGNVPEGNNPSDGGDSSQTPPTETPDAPSEE